MTKHFSTKKALLASLFSLLLCVSMLAGSTFAWFTDSATTAVNKIQAGTLDVGLIDENGKDLENESLTFMDKNGNTDILWEPGCTFLTQGFKVVNNGNLAFKYKILITGLDGDSALLDVITFSVVTADQVEAALEGRSYTDLVGEWQITFDPETGKNVATQTSAPASELMYVVAHFDEAAGNKYQGLSLEGIGITVYATQDTVEEDSFGDQYDNRVFVEVADQKALNAAIADATEPTVIFLSDGTYTLPTIKDKDIEFTGSENVVFDIANAVNASGSDLKFEGVALVFDNDNYEGFQHAANVAFENCALTGTQFLYAPVVEFVDCTFDMYNEKTEYSVWTYGAEDVTFTNCVFNTHGKAILVYNEETTSSFVANVTVSGCTFESDGTVDTEKAAIETGSNGGNTETSNKYIITVSNTTVNGFGISPKGIVTHSSVWSNKNSMDADHLTVVLNNVTENPISWNKVANAEAVKENINEDTKTVVIEDGAQLAGLAELVNEGNTFEGYTITLENDINLYNAEWTPIGDSKNNRFRGSIDGDGHTISNLNGPRGLIGYGATSGEVSITDLTLNNVTINNTAASNIGAFVGNADGSRITLSNLKLTGDVKIDVMCTAGGILGANPNGAVFASNIVVDVEEGSYVSSAANPGYYDYIGGVFGQIWGSTFENITSNIDVICGTGAGGGGISGGATGTWTNISCSGDVTVLYTDNAAYYKNTVENGNEYGQVYWYQANGTVIGYHGGVTYNNCTSTGTLTYADSGKTSNDMTWINSDGETVEDSRFGCSRWSNDNTVTIND